MGFSYLSSSRGNKALLAARGCVWQVSWLLVSVAKTESVSGRDSQSKRLFLKVVCQTAFENLKWGKNTFTCKCAVGASLNIEPCKEHRYHSAFLWLPLMIFTWTCIYAQAAFNYFELNTNDVYPKPSSVLQVDVWHEHVGIHKQRVLIFI